MVAGGSVADILGRKKIILLGLGICTLGSLLIGLTQSGFLMITGRILQGLSGAFIMPPSLALINVNFQDDAEKKRAMSFWSMSSWGGAGLSSFFGGAVTSYLGWRWIFYLTAITCILAMVLLWNIKESKLIKKSQ
ncbi:MFS transporter [Lactococcus sp. DD01]|uniref:MFS transporter n=1 Tax=Lactococcus sp. DD01 TaxID=1776443 RepID=UPI000776219B|nr:MFS transporter [Lactococcus sp. DD01]KXT59464.1 major facilitator superfamily MFS_1 [Lactococcus sp. DD01]